MRFRKLLIVGGLLCAPFVARAVTDKGISFDPAENVIGTDGKPLVTEGSIKALTYLTGASDPVTISIRLVNLLLSFLGLISMILLLYAGVVWFKARDNEEEITRAKQIIKGALTGLLLTLLAYGIAQLLFTQLLTFTTKS